MTERELLRLLKQDGWIISEGGRHHVAKHPIKSGIIPIPRHNGDIPIGTARKIIKVAELKDKLE